MEIEIITLHPEVELLNPSFFIDQKVLCQNLMVLHENPIDLALLRQFLRITAVVELIAALVGAKFLIASAFQWAATFLTKSLRNK
jgi:hypothetical protein